MCPMGKNHAVRQRLTSAGVTVTTLATTVTSGTRQAGRHFGIARRHCDRSRRPEPLRLRLHLGCRLQDHAGRNLHHLPPRGRHPAAIPTGYGGGLRRATLLRGRTPANYVVRKITSGGRHGQRAGRAGRQRRRRRWQSAPAPNSAFLSAWLSMDRAISTWSIPSMTSSARSSCPAEQSRPLRAVPPDPGHGRRPDRLGDVQYPDRHRDRCLRGPLSDRLAADGPGNHRGRDGHQLGWIDDPRRKHERHRAAAPSSSFSIPTPAGIAVDTNGTIYVADTGNDTVRSGVASVSTPPTITTQPLTQSVTVGTSVTLSVVVTGTGPFTYQWNAGGGAVIGRHQRELHHQQFPAGQCRHLSGDRDRPGRHGLLQLRHAHCPIKRTDDHDSAAESNGGSREQRHAFGGRDRSRHAYLPVELRDHRDQRRHQRQLYHQQFPDEQRRLIYRGRDRIGRHDRPSSAIVSPLGGPRSRPAPVTQTVPPARIRP